MGFRYDRLVRATGALVLIVTVGGFAVRSADKPVDLNMDGPKESNVISNVIDTNPTTVRNKVTNKAIGLTFSFVWASAGPSPLVCQGANCNLATQAPQRRRPAAFINDWNTTQQLTEFECGANCSCGPTLAETNDICFDMGPPSTEPMAFGAFNVQGRGVTDTGSSISNETLTSSIGRSMSPPVEDYRVTSSVKQLPSGQFVTQTFVTNMTDEVINYDLAPGPLGCIGDCDDFIPVTPVGSTCCRTCFRQDDACTGALPPGTTVRTTCRVNDNPSREITSRIQVCAPDVSTGLNAPCLEGVANVFIPSSVSASTVHLSPVEIQITDDDEDGAIEPGDTVDVSIALVNAGAQDLTIVSATLVDFPIDIDRDGDLDTAEVRQPLSDYPDLLRTSRGPRVSCSDLDGDGVTDPTFVSIDYPPATVSRPGTNITPFTIAFPVDHRSDVGHRFLLKVEGDIPGALAPFRMDVPFVLGVTSGDAQEGKQDVLDEIETLVATLGDDHDDDHADDEGRKRLIEAMERLERSLEPEGWIDHLHLDPREGKHVFDDERHAVKKLEELAKKLSSREAPDSIPLATVEDWIARLVAVDRRLARVALEDAMAAEGDRKHIAHAVRELARGDVERSDEDHDKSIERYRHAWEEAQKALRE